MSTISASTTSTTAYTVTADTTGTLVLQTGSGPTTAVTVGTDQSVTFAGAVTTTGNQTVTGNLSVTGSLTTTGYVNAPNTFSFKNRIINGAMAIDQRNAGASVTPAANSYTLDRWFMGYGGAATSTLSVQQTTVAPPGFSRSVKLTVVSTLASPASIDSAQIRQPIEGYNIADFNFGAVGSATITVSFWVNSSVTGLFGGALKNIDATRCYPFTYTINSANTWEKKTVTIVGDTTGTWDTTTGIGINVNFSFCNGGSTAGTAGAWAGSNLNTATGCVNLLATNGATFYITGVQLEKGSTATSFDYRPYGTELQLCQRYFSMSYPQGTVPGTATTSGLVGAAAQFASGAGGSLASISYPVQMRSTPTISLWDGAGTSNKCSYTGSANYTMANNGTFHTTGATYISSTSFFLSPTTSSANSQAYAQYTASAEL